MEETLEYWEKCLLEFEQALQDEIENDITEDSMYRLLKKEIESCKLKINELNNG